MKSRTGSICFALIATILGTAGRAVGSDWFVSVPPCNDDSATCGSSETNTCCLIQDAVNRSADGDTVWVKPGIYVGANGITNFVGKAITVISTNGPQVTVITATSGASKVKFNSGEGPSSILEGFTLTGGTGHGIEISVASPTIRGNIIRDNNSATNGGGIYVLGGVFGGSPIIEDNLICSNSAPSGGGLFAENPVNLIIRDCAFRQNSATGTGGSSGGGGIRVYTGDTDGTNTISRCVFEDNYAAGYGGAVFTNDIAAIAGSGHNLTANIENSLFIRNEAASPGGAITVGRDTVGAATHCTLSRNTAPTAAAFYAHHASGTYTVTESILWGNAVPGDIIPEIAVDSGTLVVSYSDVEEGWVGVGNINADPLFFDPSADNYHIKTGSPAINTAFGCDLTAVELDGNPRCANGVEDIGAYEYPECVVNANCDDGQACNGVETCVTGVCDRDPIDDCNCNGVHDDCDITNGTSKDCNVNGTPDECETGSILNALILAVPAHEHSLWRNQKNIMRFTFACDITAPGAGQVPVQEMLNNGAFGSDLSTGFTFTVGNGNVLKVKENSSTLAHRKWYAIRNTGGWSGVGNFEVQYVVQAGDANDDGRVLYSDLSLINTGIPTDPAADNDRRDINGDGRILYSDMGAANANIPSDTVVEPTGHEPP